MDFKAVMLAAVLGAMGGVGGSYFALKPQNQALQNRLHQTPPVVVVDFGAVVASYPEGASEAEMDRLMANTNNAILRLKEAGYLVLDAASIIAAPEDVYLPEEVIGQ